MMGGEGVRLLPVEPRSASSQTVVHMPDSLLTHG